MAGFRCRSRRGGMAWQLGRRMITARRIEAEGPLPDFRRKALGQSGFPGCRDSGLPAPGQTDYAAGLRSNTQFNRILHEHVVIVSVQSENVPHIPPDERLAVDEFGYSDDGIVHLAIRVGFLGDQDSPADSAGSGRAHQRAGVQPDAAF